MAITEAQKQLRKSGIGGSDEPILMGLDTPYNAPDPYTLYLGKRGEVELPERFTEWTSWGDLMEEPIATAYAERTGVKLQRDNQTYRSKERPYMLGHVDRRIVGQPRKRLEVKQSMHRHLWGRDGTADVPAYVMAQCQHYIYTLELDEMDVATLLAGSDFRIYTLPRDDEFIRMMLDIADEFWDRVEAGVPPEPQWQSRAITDLLTHFYPGTDGNIIQLPEEAQKWSDLLTEAKARAGEYEAIVTGCKNHLRMLMGNAAVALLPDGTCYTRKEVQRGAYQVEATSYMDFRHGKPTKAVKEAIERGDVQTLTIEGPKPLPETNDDD
jgi:putative phage-type endonuclease